MEPVRQVRVAVPVRGMNGDGAQEIIGLGTLGNQDSGDTVAGRVGPGGEELGPHGRAGVIAGDARLISVRDQAEVLVHDQEVPQRVQGALFAAGEYHAAVERPGAGHGRTGAPDADAGLAEGPGRVAVEQLRAVVVGAGPGGGVCERVALADFVRGVGLVSPGAVVEVRVVVGDPGAVEPVDRHAPVGFVPGGVGVLPGVGARRAHQRRLPQGNRSPRTHETAGVNDLGNVFRREVVVGMDARVGGVRRIFSDEQKAEGVAGAEVVGDQRVVGIDPFGRKNRGALGGRGPGAGTIGVEGTHLDVVILV